VKLYKLTNQENETKHNTKWGVNITQAIPKEAQCKALCSYGILHAYKSIELGLLLNPAHADIEDPKIWEAKGTVVVKDYGKVGCFELTTVKEIPVPNWYTDEKLLKKIQLQFAILCAESVLHIFETQYPDDDRPRKAIEAAKNYLGNPNKDNTIAATAASSAARAAFPNTGDGVYYAARAARSAVCIAYVDDPAIYVARAARSAYATGIKINFNKLAKQAVKLICK